MPTNTDRYCVGNYYHAPKRRPRHLFARYLAAILGLMALLALLSLKV